MSLLLLFHTSPPLYVPTGGSSGSWSGGTASRWGRRDVRSVSVSAKLKRRVRKRGRAGRPAVEMPAEPPAAVGRDDGDEFGELLALLL